MGRLAPMALKKLPVHSQFDAMILGSHTDKALCLSPFFGCEVRYKPLPISTSNAHREEIVKKVS